MDLIYTNLEVGHWSTAADEGGLTLPARIVSLRAEHEAADKALRALERPDEPTSPERLVGQGWSPGEAMAEADRRHAAIASWRREHDVLAAVRSHKANALNRAVAEDVEDLVMLARPVVTEIVEAARPLIPKLARFAPGYEPERIVAKATSVELKAYQALMALQVRFDAIHKAWAGSYVTPARVNRTYEASNAPSTFSWSAAEMPVEFFYWAEPSLVANPRLNGQALSRSGRPLPLSTSLLLIAAEDPEAGYRLAVFPELRERAHQQWAARMASVTGRTYGSLAL